MADAMSRFAVRVLLPLAALVVAGLSAGQGFSAANVLLRGVVKSPDGKPLDGVAVSTRAEGKTITTTVYTGRDGAYFFPPLDDGSYKLWAQAVGFEAARTGIQLSSAKAVTQDLTLHPLQDFGSAFTNQLSSPEWMESLPEETPEDRRAKRLLGVNCNTCHQVGMALRNRFDAKGWTSILDFMERTGGEGGQGEVLPYLHAYKEEMLAYLMRVRGPDSPPLKYKLLPRPSGESAQVVITEFDIPPGHQPGTPVFDNGSDWSQGIPSHYESRSPHDAVVDRNGFVWFTDQATPKRTIGKLDSRTGQVTDYTLLDRNGVPMATHDIALDRAGGVWTNVSSYAVKEGRRTGDGFFVRFDPKTEKFQEFHVPSSLPPVGSGLLNIDSKGNVWASVSGGSLTGEESAAEVVYRRPKVDPQHPGGALKLNPKTGEYTFYKAVTPVGVYYGVVTDAEDNAWFVQPGYDRVNVADAKTGKVGEITFPPLENDDVEYTAKDRDLAATYEAGAQSGPPWHLGPRRGAADKDENVVWYDAAQGNQLVKIDIHTKKVTKYAMPRPYIFPYGVAVDKSHMVWITTSDMDGFFKFNPFTEKFTEYPLPARGTDARFVSVDNSTDPPTIWLPYYGASKIARIQFRKTAN